MGLFKGFTPERGGSQNSPAFGSRPSRRPSQTTHSGPDPHGQLAKCRAPTGALGSVTSPRARHYVITLAGGPTELTRDPSRASRSTQATLDAERLPASGPSCSGKLRLVPEAAPGGFTSGRERPLPQEYAPWQMEHCWLASRAPEGRRLAVFIPGAPGLWFLLPVPALWMSGLAGWIWSDGKGHIWVQVHLQVEWRRCIWNLWSSNYNWSKTGKVRWHCCLARGKTSPFKWY